MPGVIAYVTLAASKFPTDTPLLRRVTWGARSAPTTEAFDFIELDGGTPVFDYTISSATDTPGPALIGIDADGWYVDVDGAQAGEEADVYYDGDGLVFTPRGA